VGSWEVDTSRWPIVIHAVDGALTDEELDAYIHEATLVLQRGEKHVAIMDGSKASWVSAQVRNRARAFQRANRELLGQVCVGTVYVVPSAVLRFVVMTVLLVGQLPMPYFVCETREEAIAWAQERLRAQSG